MTPPLHSRGQGFESPRLHFYKFVWLIDLWGDDALIEEARRHAVDEIQESAENNVIIEQAQTNAEDSLRAFVTSLGYEEVVFT
jgi:Protein of unknown function (DUF4230)